MLSSRALVRRRMPFAIALVTLTGVLALASPRGDAHACMILGAGTTKIAGEEVLIVWDAANRTEHFVRHLSFSDASDDFGFLVPTPKRPELGEVEDAVFTRLFEQYRAPLPPPTRGGRGRPRGIPANALAPAAVQVVEQRVVAGLDATVLAATDAAALNAWLAAHHYPSTPAMTAYLAPYVAQGYFVTAFKYAGGGASFGTRAVRMTFETERAYFPYAEPQGSPRVPGRVFRVSVVANGRVTGALRTPAGIDHVWTAETRFAKRLPSLRRVLRGVVPSRSVSSSSWLTTFEEVGAARGADDLFFDRAPRQAPVASTITERVP